jgi:hypothetical protein
MNTRYLVTGLASFVAASLLSSVANAASPSIPVPVMVRNGQVQFDGVGNAIPEWDGSSVDLLAADAWAQCQPVFDGDFVQQIAAADASLAFDSYLQYLLTRMESAVCPVSDPPPSAQLAITCPQGCVGVQFWAQQRETPACNVDPSTGRPAVVTFYSNSNDTVLMPPASTFVNLSGNVDVAAAGAQYEIDIAELNLCMGQRLTEYVSSADSLLLSAADQLQLVEVIRERAQMAMLHFAQIGRALVNSPNSTVDQVTDFGQIFPVFRSWAMRAAGDAALTQLGQDFAVAVQLHTQTTQEEAQLLARTASARLPRGGNPQSTPETDWGSGSWRQRVNALFYGGNPLSNGQSGSGDIDFTQPSGIQRWLNFSAGSEGNVPWDPTWTQDAWSIRAWPNQVPPFGPDEAYSTTDLRDPRAQVLFGLARKADALLLKERIADALVPPDTADFLPAVILPFRRVDVPTSAAQMYLDVEAYLQTQVCVGAGNPSCVVPPSASDGSPITDYRNDLLFQRYGVTPDHATMLVSALADAISRQQLPALGIETFLLASNFPNSPVPPSFMTEAEGALHVVGAHATLSPSDLAARIPNATGTWYYLDKNLSLRRPVGAERAPLFSINVPNWSPTTYDENATAFAEGWGQLDQAKDMGALSALTVVRDLLDLAMNAAAGNSGLLTTYFAQAAPITAAIDAAVSAESVSIRPLLDVGLSNINGSLEPTQTSLNGGAQVVWEVTFRQAPENAFFDGVSDDQVQLVAVAAQGLEATAALDPNFVSIGGQTQFDLLVNATMGFASQQGPSTTLPDGAVLRTYDIVLPSSAFLSNEATSGFFSGPVASLFVSFFIVKDGSDTQPAQYFLLARHVGLYVDGQTINQAAVYSPFDGQYFAYGGTLGDISKQAWATQVVDWSKPGFDGFGYPTDWVPPSDPSLYGGTAATSAIQYYLDSAQTAAAAAGTAIQSAIGELLLEDSDNATLAVAQKKAASLDNIAAAALCGAFVCDTSSQTVDLYATGFLSPLTCSTSASPSALCTALSATAIPKLPSTVMLATPVVDVMNNSAPPSFGAYQGGTLQGKLIAEWTALQNLKGALATADAQEQAQDADVAQADANLQAAMDARAFDCSKEAFNGAADVCWSTSVDPGAFQVAPTYGPDGWDYHFDNVNGRTFNAGPLWAQVNLCLSDRRNLPAEEAKDAAVMASAYAWLPTAVSSLLDSGSALQQAIADAALALHSAQVAQAQAGLDAILAGQNLQTKFGTSVRFHSYDMWRAEALLESARRYAVAARREIEARYVVDLSDLQGPEPFVAAPAAWADGVYEYDLSPPSAVGLTTNANSSAPANAIYANVVTDYVSNLSGFVQGFAVNRPSATVGTDDDMFTLGGPDRFDTVTLTGQPVQVLSQGSLGWQFWCDNSSSWIINPAAGQLPGVDTLMTACGGAPPSRARIQFTLDPWARPNGVVANPPFVDRYNTRWVQLAVNLVGTGLLDCSLATDPSTCFSQSYVRMNLEQIGPAWVSDFDENWRFNGAADGRIEGGKALAAEQWLDPVANGFSKPYVAAVARSELRDRPVGGTYELELELGPEVVLSQLQSVQVLTETAYWVKQ